MEGPVRRPLSKNARASTTGQRLATCDNPLPPFRTFDSTWYIRWRPWCGGLKATFVTGLVCAAAAPRQHIQQHMEAREPIESGTRSGSCRLFQNLTPWALFFLTGIANLNCQNCGAALFSVLSQGIFVTVAWTGRKSDVLANLSELCISGVLTLACPFYQRSC